MAAVNSSRCCFPDTWGARCSRRGWAQDLTETAKCISTVVNGETGIVSKNGAGDTGDLYGGQKGHRPLPISYTKIKVCPQT